MLEEMKVKWNGRDSLSEEFVFRRFVRSSDDDPHKVLRQDERDPLSIDTKLLLLMVQEMTKVYMKYLKKIFLQVHDFLISEVFYKEQSTIS